MFTYVKKNKVLTIVSIIYNKNVLKEYKIFFLKIMIKCAL